MRGAQGQRRDVAHVSRPHKSARCLHAISLPCRPQKWSAPAEHLHLPRSLDKTILTNFGKDMSGVTKLAEVLPQTKLQSLR